VTWEQNRRVSTKVVDVTAASIQHEGLRRSSTSKAIDLRGLGMVAR
jgi:hypothetical protein